MNWFLIALAGYFFYAVVTILNKYLLRQRATTKPLVFTFWLGILSIFTFVLAPFGLHWPGWGAFALDFFVGVLFFLTLLTFYKALDINEASRAASVIGGVQPIFILLLSWVFLSEKLTWLQISAFLILIVGGFLLSLERNRGRYREGIKGLKIVAWAIVLGAIYMIFAKHIFEQQGFITGFVWMRVGLVAAAIAVLFKISWRRAIFSSARQASGGLSLFFIASKLLASLGSLCIHLAVAWGSVTLVSAMAGSEYAFLFVLILMLSRKFPEFLYEKSSWQINIQKTVAILLIGGGLAILAF